MRLIKIKMSQESQRKPIGNTMEGSSARNQLYRWQFTLKAGEPDSYSPEELFWLMKDFCKEFVFQLEKGESGYLHYQGVISLKNKEYRDTVKNLFGRKDIHLEPVADKKKLEKYCMKEDTRVSGPWSIHSTWIKTITSFRDWQMDLIEKLKIEPDDRKIVWYSDPEGGAGKTQMAKYLAVHHKAIVLTNGRTQDLAYCIKTDTKIVVLNFSRSNEDHINYGAIESIKDGLLFSGKYESCTKVFNSPHVIVFANSMPCIEKMSKDRWEIIELSKEKEFTLKIEDD